MKKIVVLACTILILLLIDNCVGPFIGINGYSPSFLFVFALSYSMISGEWSCILIGIVTGFLQDINFFNGFGVNLFTNVLLCFVAGQIGKNLFKEKIFMPTISIFGLAFIKGILLFVILYMCGEFTNIYFSFYNALYDFVVAILIYRITYKLCEKEYMIKTWKF